MASNLNICTYNARGLRQQNKRRSVFAYLHNLNFDIYFVQETHSDHRDEIYWRNEWGGEIVFSHGNTSSRGVCIMFKPTLSFEIMHKNIHDTGRFIILDIKLLGCTFTLCCIYGPNVDDPVFYQSFVPMFGNFECDNVIMGGDFNFVFNFDLDKQNGNRRTNFNARDECVKLMNYFDLVDIWRERNPQSKYFSWRSNVTPGIHCRLDFFLISRKLSANVQCDKFFSGLKSDHSIVSLSLNSFVDKRGPGFWKFNNSLLEDNAYIQHITEVISREISVTRHLDPSLRWDFLKYKIRSVSISYSKEKARKRRLEERIILSKINSLEKSLYHNFSEEIYTELRLEQNKLNHIYDLKLKGIMVRARARWVEEGEKSTRYFLNLEKRNKNYNVIRYIKSDDDVLVTSRKSILHELKMFYKALYTSENTNPDHYFDGFAPEKRLSEEVSQQCDGLLTIEECLIALNSMSLNKSPGCDGLTVNFYKHFWYLIGQLVVDALNNAYHKGELSPEQRRGIITLIPKPGKDPKLMKNLRPITLLNTDYKIGA